MEECSRGRIGSPSRTDEFRAIRMRTLYLNHTSQMSGGEHSLMLLLEGLPDEVLPILGCPEGPLESAGRAADIPWVPITGTAGSLKLHPLYTAAAVRDLTHAALEVRQTCNELSIDLIHANSIRAGLVAAVTVAHLVRNRTRVA